MPLSVTITVPQNSSHLQVGQQYRIAGTIQGRPADDPPVISAVVVRGPGSVGPVQTQRVTGRQGVWNFVAQGVAGGAGIFTVTAEVTDEDSRKTRANVTVFVGLVYSPTAPAILFDVVPALFEVGFPFLAPKLQAAFAPLTALLASGGGVLVGPNQSQNRGLPKAAAPGAASVGTERIALWILDANATPAPPTFSVTRANPPGSLLPVLPQPAVAATFDPPSTLVPAPTVTDPMASLGNFGFGLTISVATLQSVASALLSRLQTDPAIAKQGVSVNSISVQCSPPNIVKTVVKGNKVVDFTLTITEILSIVASPRSTTGQMVPAVTGTATINAPAVDLLEALLAVITPILGPAILREQKDKASASVNNALSLANASFSGLPEVIAFGASGGLGGLFPGVIPNWTALSASASGITAAGTFVLRSRTAADAFVGISGPSKLAGSALEFAGGATAAYVVSWVGIIPDATTFTATISGSGPGGVQVIPLPADGRQSTSIVLTFAFATDSPKPGRYQFLITVNATETSAADRSKTLSAMARFSVTVHVLRSGEPRSHTLPPRSHPGSPPASGGTSSGSGGRTTPRNEDDRPLPPGGYTK